MIIDPINTETDNSIDLIGSPIQNQEQPITQIKVVNLICNDFFEKVWPIISSNFDI